MARIVEGIAVIAAAVIGAAAVSFFLGPAAGALFYTLMSASLALGTMGASMLASGIAKMLGAGPSLPFSVRSPSASRQVIYGQCRVAGTIIYISTSNSGSYLNQVVCWAGHQIQSIDNVYLDARLVVPSSGTCDGNQHTDDSGNNYNFNGEVYCEHALGTAAGHWFNSLYSTDPSWGSACTLNGIAASYIRCNYDSTVFPGEPGIKANVHGKNTIWDPRLGSYGASGAMVYTSNAALCLADVLLNSDYGLGCLPAEINTAQLIVAANICDELVPLAFVTGQSESMYTINGFFDMSSSPGEIISAMLQAMAGKLTYVGGVFGIYPGVWNGLSGNAYNDSSLIGPVKWLPQRKYRDLFNAVRGQFISPKYPYSIVGYDRDHRDSSIFGGEWQPADFPEYAQDALHGYVSDANLAEDGGKLYSDLSLRFVTSVATAQRIAKITLLRNRFQGTGTLQMNLAALENIPGDIIYLTFVKFGWVNKPLEILAIRFQLTDEAGDEKTNGAAVKRIVVEVDVIETDPSIYNWSLGEELSITNAQSPQIGNTWMVNPPSGLTLESGLDSAVTGADGIVIPRINVTWLPPLDPFVTSGGSIEIQYQQNGAATWLPLGFFTATTTQTYITGVVCGHLYNVQMRAKRSNGAASGWVSAGPFTVSTTLSSVSYENVSGLGALATSNFVDFSTSSVINKTANNLTYATGYSVQSLMPADVNASASVGISQISNPGFELNNLGGLADGWTVSYDAQPAAFFVARSLLAMSGNYSLNLQTASGTTYAAGPTPGVRVKSTLTPCSGNQPVFFGSGICAQWNTAIPAGLTTTVRIAVCSYDVNRNLISEISLGDIYNQTVPYTGATSAAFGKLSGYGTTPANTCFINLELCLFVQATATVTVGTSTSNSILMSVFFDGAFLTIQPTSSGLLNAQGSILPNQSPTFTWSASSTTATVTVPNAGLLRSDGSTLQMAPGVNTLTGLSPSTTYYTYWYISLNPATYGYGLMTNPLPPPTTPSATYMMQTALDGRIPVGAVIITTSAASGGTGTSGTAGGGDRCPESSELVDVQSKGLIAASAVEVGDLILGKSFYSGFDVYRAVLNVSVKSCSAWSVVSGHKVTPCECVYLPGAAAAAPVVSAVMPDGTIGAAVGSVPVVAAAVPVVVPAGGGLWVPAFQVPGATFDQTLSSYVAIMVASDNYDESNYYLAAGSQLLIHNMQLPEPC